MVTIVPVRASTDTLANWNSLDPIPKLGEPCVAIDANRFKWGNGTDPFSALPYSGVPVWGEVTGTLADQADLQAALNAKEPAFAVGAVGQYLRGDKSWQTLDKAAVGLGNLSNSVTGAGNVVLASGPTIDAPILTGVIRGGTSNPGVGTLRIGVSGADAAYISSANVGAGGVLGTFAVGTVTGNATGLKVTGSTTGDLSFLNQQNGTGSGLFEVLLGAASTGDAYIRLGINGGQAWSVGLDNSDDDSFKVSSGYLPGSADALRIDRTSKRAQLYGPLGLASYTVGTVPAATLAAGLIYVSNESGGAVPAFSDGANWRRVTDRAVIS